MLDLVSPFLLRSVCFLSLFNHISPSVTSSAIKLLTAARQRGHLTPVLSPADALLRGPEAIDTEAIQKAGFPVVVWTVNDPVRMRGLISLGVDGVISDRPDLLRKEADIAHSKLDVEGHRGGRDLRPENTLPAFESGLDHLITTIETDTGVTEDRVSLISHEQFINPQTCRTAAGGEYTAADKVWIKDITMADAAKRFICDRTFRGPQQRNDLALSPVSVAFARENRMISPYSPTNAGQLFEFVSFYANYYRNGAGRTTPAADERASNAEKVRFNLETKITPAAEAASHTFSPEVFVQTLSGAIRTHKMEARSDIQSFDFRTLAVVETQFPLIRTVYLIENAEAAR